MPAATGSYHVGGSWLHRRNPLTKLVGLGFVLLVAFLLPNVVLAPMAATCLAVAASTGLLGVVFRSLRIPAVLLGSILVINALFFPGATDRLVSVGPFAITGEGLGFGLATAGRLLVAFLASVLFLFATLADDLLESLVAHGVSHRIAFVVLSAVQLVPRLGARAASILEAQQARGLRVEGSVLRRLRALVPLVGPVVLGSLVDVRERTFALEARGFGARRSRTAYRIVTDPPADRWIRLALLLASAGVVVAALTGVVR